MSSTSFAIIAGGVLVIMLLLLGLLIVVALRQRASGTLPAETAESGRYLASGIAIGAGFGVALGLVLDNIAIGISLGTAMGVSVGVALDARNQPPRLEQARARQLLMAVLLAGFVLLIALLGTLLIVNG